MLCTPLLYILFGPFVDDSIVQIILSPGPLADDANDMDIGINIIDTIGLQGDGSALNHQNGCTSEPEG